MKTHSSNHYRFQDKIIYLRVSKRGGAIFIIRDNIRLDNFQGFPHIHIEGEEKSPSYQI